MGAENLNMLIDDQFRMEYVVWSNYDLPIVEESLDAFRLSAFIFDILGFSGGYVNTYNKNFTKDADYPAGLQYLGYHMLEDGADTYEPTEMKMGIRTICIADVIVSTSKEKNRSSILTIKGENFTPFSYILVNGRVLETEYVDCNTLIVEYVNELIEGDVIAVAQIGTDTEILSMSEPYDR